PSDSGSPATESRALTGEQINARQWTRVGHRVPGLSAPHSARPGGSLGGSRKAARSKAPLDLDASRTGAGGRWNGDHSHGGVRRCASAASALGARWPWPALTHAAHIADGLHPLLFQFGRVDLL